MDTSPFVRYRRAVAAVAAAAALLIVFLAFRKGGTNDQSPEAAIAAQASAPPAPPSPPPPPPPSQFAECRELEAVYERMAKKLGCSEDRDVTRAICEAAFTRTPSCEKEMKAAVACAKNEPETSWKCHPPEADAAAGEAVPKVGLIDTACVAEVGALRVCLQSDQ